MKTKIKSLITLLAGYTMLVATRVYAVPTSTSDPALYGANQAKDPSQPTDLLVNIKAITNAMLIAIGVISVIMIVIGGIRYTVSGGDEKGTKGAKDTILYSIVGLVVALLAFAIVNFVLTTVFP